MYLGAYWSDVFLGKVIDFKGTRFFVRGIMEKNSYIISEDVWLGNANNLSTTVNIDDWVMIADGDDDSNDNMSDLCFRVKDGENPKDVIRDLVKINKENGSSDGVLILNDAIKETNQSYSEILRNLVFFLAILLVTVIAIYFVQQVVHIEDNREYYGIFYANGATIRDMVKIQLFKSMLQFTSSIVVAIGIIVLMVASSKANMDMYGVAFPDTMVTMLKVQAIPVTIILNYILSVVVSVAPIVVISRIAPYEMMLED